jgi:uncharacterized membrane protein YesL
MGRARVPAAAVAPGLGSAIRTSLSDAYYHSWRLLPANLVWALTAMAVSVVALVAPPAIVLFALLAVPTAGIFRVTTRIVRGESVSFWDAVDAWRSDLLPTLAFGLGFVAGAIVLTSNVVTGLTSGSPLGWALATLAGWGIAALTLYAWALWPILADPRRADRSVADRSRLAGLLVLAHPLRLAALALALAALLVVSAVAIVALVTISVSFAALVASRSVLPAADRLEAQLAARTPHAAGATSAASDPGIGDMP